MDREREKAMEKKNARKEVLESCREEGVSRKAFLKGAGVMGLAGTLATSGLLAGCSQEAAGTTGDAWWLPANWDYEADVVVLGFGAAGGGAAYEAREQGASVIIVDAAPEEFAGGASTAFVGYLGRFTHGANTLVSSSLGTMDMAMAKTIEAEADRLIPLVDEAGINWAGQPDPSMALINGAGMEFYRVFSQIVKDSGPEILYETPAKELIVNPQTREVVGVKAEQAGKEIFIKANKGVVIATGSFIANTDMVNSFHITPQAVYTNDGSPYDNGDGLKMAARVGARLSYMSMGLEWAHWSYLAPSLQYNTAVRVENYAYLPAMDGSIAELGGVPVAQFSRINVNYSGERFANEFEGYDHDKSQVPFLKFNGKITDVPNKYVNLPAFMVFDQAQFDAGPIGPHDMIKGWNGLRKVYNWSADNKAELEAGWIVKADTLDELAPLMQSGDYTVDAEALKATVATYNAHCAAGVDPDFGRSPEMMMPIGEGPYYAIEITPAAYYTIGGLTGNIDSQTLDVDDEPIPRLYSAGNVGQGSYTFPIGVSGCFGRGVLAGRHAASLAPWE